MRNIKIGYLLCLLVLVHGILRSLDGFDVGDVSAILIVSTFALVFYFFSGMKDGNGLKDWVLTSKAKLSFLLLLVVSVTLQIFLVARWSGVALVFALATTLETLFIFLTMLVLGGRIKEKLSGWIGNFSSAKREK